MLRERRPTAAGRQRTVRCQSAVGAGCQAAAGVASFVVEIESPSHSEVAQGPRLWWWAPIAVGAVSVAFVVMSLMNVDFRSFGHANAWRGYVHVRWWLAAWLLVIPLFVTARRTRAVAWLTVVCAAVPQWVLLVVMHDRVDYVRGHTYESPDFPYDWAADVTVAGMTIVFVLTVLAGRRFTAATGSR